MIGRSAASCRPLLKATGVVSLVVALASCGKPPPMTAVFVAPPDCEMVPAPREAMDTITVVLFDRVSLEFAPWGHNPSEQQLFRYLYETLITVDCLGDAHAGLAESWKREDGGLQWVFELRGGARFWDGSRVTSGDVIRSWEDALMLETGIDSAVAERENVLRVYLKYPHLEVPRVFSAPAFGVAKRSGYWEWPIGSGLYRIVSAERTSLASGISGTSRRAITVVPASDEGKPVIRFVEAFPKDARDLLDEPIDLMVTADPTVIEYAAGNPQLTTVPLPWEKTYVLLAKSRVEESRNHRPPGAIPADLRDGLAAQAVLGEARGYRPPAWWDDLFRCDQLFEASANLRAEPLRGVSSSASRRILYDVDDPTAQGLAERIVALAGEDPSVSSEAAAVASALPGLVEDRIGVVSEGVASRELDRSLRGAADFAYIVPFQQRPPLPCDEVSRLLDRAPWLAVLGTDFSGALLPLVDTRAHAIVRRDKFGLVCDWYGDIRIVNETSTGK